MKRLNGYAAEMISEGETVLEMDGKRYFLSSMEERETTVREDIEHNPELRQKLLLSKKDIIEGNVFSTDEVIKMIVQGEL